MREINDIDRNDDLSRLFRDGAEGLEESPSFKAWDRLEHKLDSRKLRKRASVYRYTSMVAAAIGLIGIIMVFQLLDKVGTLDQTSAETEVPIAEVENLTEDERRIAQAIQEHKWENEEFHEEDAITIDDKEVVNPTNNNYQQDTIVTNYTPVPAPKFKKEQIAKDKAKKVAEEKTEKKPTSPIAVLPSKSNTEPADEMPVLDDVALAEEEFEESAPNYLDALAKEGQKSKDKADRATKEEKVKVADKYNRDANTASESLALEEVTISSKKRNSSYNKNEKGKTQEVLSQEVVTKFSWMAGNWKDALKSESFENWYISDNQIIGEGYILIKGKKQFTEYMKIYEKNNQIYLETSVDNSKKFKKFKLVSYDETKATFERSGKKFPTQVIIKRVSPKAYTITYNNKNDKSLNSSQAKYFNQRNSITTRRASRSMNKY